MKQIIFEIICKDQNNYVQCQDEISLIMLQYKMNKKYKQLTFSTDKNKMYAIFNELQISPQLIYNALKEIKSISKLKQISEIKQEMQVDDYSLFLKVQMLIFVGLLVIYTVDYLKLL